MTPLPPKEDGLRAFLRAANENERDCLAEYTDFVRLIDKIDSLFLKVVAGEFRGDPISAMLFVNARASFLAATRIAFSGQVPPTHMALRGAVESALYGLIASRSEENRAVWLSRENDRDRCRQLYTAHNAIKLLKDDPALFDILNEFYELAIDFGAHPNLRSVFEHVSLENTVATLTYLHPVPSNQTIRAIVACIETGLNIIFISPHAFPDNRNARDAHAEASQIRIEFDRYIREQGYLGKEVSGRPLKTK